MAAPTCAHVPSCPSADAADRDAARVVRRQYEQSWLLLCNGVIVFDDTGELLPDGRSVAPHRPRCRVATPPVTDAQAGARADRDAQTEDVGLR